MKSEGDGEELSRDLISLWHSLVHEVHKATVSLMYLLEGMEFVRNSQPSSRNRFPPNTQQSVTYPPSLSYIDILLCVSGHPPYSHLNESLEYEGEAEQLAFKGWVEQVYNSIWDSRFRNELKEGFEGPGAIRPETDLMGDLGYIRNDLVHKKGIASKKETGKCTVLKWFKPGDRIILGMRHVFDFLNQMGLMTTTPNLHREASTFWLLTSDKEEALANKPTPELISLRTWTDEGSENDPPRHTASIVFENGIFLNIHIQIDHAPDSRSLREEVEFIGKARIDKRGILFPDGRVIDREGLYRKAVDALLGKGSKTNSAGVLGLEFKIRR